MITKTTVEIVGDSGDNDTKVLVTNPHEENYIIISSVDSDGVLLGEVTVNISDIEDLIEVLQDML